jgi:hypothetical protein
VIVAGLFRYPMIVHLLIGLMVEADYPLAVRILTSSPISLSLSHANDGDLGLVGCLK